MRKRLNEGNPWKHELKITRLEENILEAEATNAGDKKWLIASAAVLFLVSGGLLTLGIFSFSKSIGGSITAIAFAIIAAFFAVGCIGSLSYAAKLSIDDASISFSRCFFWSWKEYSEPRDDELYLMCWEYDPSTGPRNDARLGPQRPSCREPLKYHADAPPHQA